jgi:uncharacterized SAM-binding protein YcdF (DUF218 family)
MFFILSKLLLFLLSPAFWIILFLVWSLFTKKPVRKKILRILSACLFIIFTNPFLFNFFVLKWQAAPATLPNGKTYSTAILLAGITGLDKNNKAFFGTDADRFIQATKLYHSGYVQNIAVTGGYPALFKKIQTSEAEQLKQELLAQGIPGEHIIIETRSRNTYENAVFVKRILDSLKLPPPYVLVTSALHVPRAKAAFKKAGIDVVVYPAAFRQINHEKGIEDFLVPSTNLLAGWSLFLKEVVGFTVYKWTGKA